MKLLDKLSSIPVPKFRIRTKGKCPVCPDEKSGHGPDGCLCAQPGKRHGDENYWCTCTRTYGRNK
jgi:hypothetical protein